MSRVKNLFFYTWGKSLKDTRDTEGWPRVVPDFYRLKPPRWPSASSPWEFPSRSCAPELPRFTRYWFISVFLPSNRRREATPGDVHPRGAVMCARALTRALLSLNISVGRHPTRLPTSARDRSLSPPFCGFFGAHYLLSKGGNRSALFSPPARSAEAILLRLLLRNY